MQFEPLTLAQIEAARPYFRYAKSGTCDLTVGDMFMWRDYFRKEYAFSGGAFYSRLHDTDGTVYYNLPLAEDIPAALCALLRSLPPEDGPVRFCTVPEAYLPVFRSIHEATVSVEEPSLFDYVYGAQDLIELKGKAYSGQRNLISQFRRATDESAFIPITAENAGLVREFFVQTFPLDAITDPFAREDARKTLEVLDNLDVYGMFGGYLTADGRIVGFSLGEYHGSTLFTHIEKADRTVKGAYQMLVNSFTSAYARDGIDTVNREEDMGDPGLRTAKQAYHPKALLKKYTVVIPLK